MSKNIDSHELISSLLFEGVSHFNCKDFLSAEEKFIEAKSLNDLSIGLFKTGVLSFPKISMNYDFFIRRYMALCFLEKGDYVQARSALVSNINEICAALNVSFDNSFSSELFYSIIDLGHLLLKDQINLHSTELSHDFLLAFKTISSLDIYKLEEESLVYLLEAMDYALLFAIHQDSFDNVFYIKFILSIVTQLRKSGCENLDKYDKLSLNMLNESFEDFFSDKSLFVPFNKQINIGDELLLCLKNFYALDHQIGFLSMEQKLSFEISKRFLEVGNKIKYAQYLLYGWRANETAFFEHQEYGALKVLSARVAYDRSILNNFKMNSELEEINDIFDSLSIH